MPVPPSQVAVPPNPSQISSTPESKASAIISPVPKELEYNGLRSPGATRPSPLAAAVSITAILPSATNPYSAVMERPRGSVQLTFLNMPSSSSVMTFVKPSPPSEIGTTVASPGGKAAIAAFPASCEVRQPLKESMAMIAFKSSFPDRP